MDHDAILLDDAGRSIVTATVVEVCDHRGWPLLAVNARTNHVHVVVSSLCTPEQAMVTFKAWCTRRLREAMLVTEETRVWSRHGSTRYLWTEAHVRGAVKYVAEGQ
jgi:REP element-mobilizing transposase RayT